MHERQGLTVHLVGQQGVRVQGLGHGKTALVRDLGGIADDFVGAVIGALEHDLNGVVLHAGKFEDVAERDASPLGVAHDTVALDLLHPGADAEGLGVVFRHRAVAAALEGDLEALLRKGLDVIEGQGQFALDLTIDLQAIGVNVDFGAVLPVVADVKEIIGDDVILQRRGRRSEGAQAGIGGDDLGFRASSYLR